MRDGYYAIYKNKEYMINRTMDDELELYSFSLEDLKNGFEPCKPFIIKGFIQETVVCKKKVKPLELDEVYEINLQAVYKGMRFFVSAGKEGTNIIYLETPFGLPYIPAGGETEIETVKPLIEMGFYGVQLEYSSCCYIKALSIDDPEIEFIEEKEDVPWFSKMRKNAEDKERHKRWHLKKYAARCGEYSFYKGKEYQVVRTDTQLMLNSESFSDLKNGFEVLEPLVRMNPAKERIVCFKVIDPSEAEEIYIIRQHAVYKGMVFNVICEKEEADRITLETPYCIPNNATGEQLEIKNALTERGFCEGRHEGFGSRYEKDVPADDFALEIIEERIETDDKFIPIKRKSKVIKCGKYAVYKGREYPVRQNEDNSITLLSGELEDIDKGFELCEPFIREFTEEEVVCIKHADPSEVEKMYKIRVYATYEGEYLKIIRRDMTNSVILSTPYCILDNLIERPLEVQSALFNKGFRFGALKFYGGQCKVCGRWYEMSVLVDDPKLEIIQEMVETNSKFIMPEKERGSIDIGEYAVYKGNEYISYLESNGQLMLCSSNMDDLKSGFKVCEPFICRYTGEEIVCIKYVDLLEVEDYYELITKVLYKGYEFYAGTETDEEIQIAAVAEKNCRGFIDMEMKCIAGGIYTKWIKKSEAEIKIVREDVLWFKELKQREADKGF